MTPSDIVVTPSGARFGGRRYPCSIGRGGVTDRKVEGDMATPRGVHHIIGCLFRPDRIARPNMWAEPIFPGDEWSDDITDPEYNSRVRAPHGFGHEELRLPGPLYDLVLLTDWNWPECIPGRGSAIFIHRWRKPRHPTAGCVAFDPLDLRDVVARIEPTTRLIVT